MEFLDNSIGSKNQKSFSSRLNSQSNDQKDFLSKFDEFEKEKIDWSDGEDQNFKDITKKQKSVKVATTLNSKPLKGSGSSGISKNC